MARFDFIKQPSKRRLLFFVPVLIVVLATLWANWSGIQCWRIRRFLADSQLKQAHQLAKSVSKSYPNCGECQFLFSKTSRRSGDFSDAAKFLQKANELGWDSNSIHREKVLTTVQLGGVERAEADLNRIFASELLPTDTEEVYEAIAYGHLAAFNGPEFLKCIDFWIEWRPQAIKPKMMKAEFLTQLGNHTHAVEQYKSILSHAPDYVPARQGLGEGLLTLNFAAEAEPELRASFNATKSARSALSLSKCLVQIGNPKEAQLLLTPFEETADKQVRSEILEELGRWHLDRSEPEQAIKFLQKCVKLSPELSSAWHALSGAYGLNGETEKAAAALKISQDTKIRCQRLVNVINELSTKPAKNELRIEAAEILFEQNMPVDAVAWLQTVLNRDLHHRDANQMLMEHFQNIGDTETARRHMQLGGL